MTNYPTDLRTASSSGRLATRGLPTNRLFRRGLLRDLRREIAGALLKEEPLAAAILSPEPETITFIPLRRFGRMHLRSSVLEATQVPDEPLPFALRMFE